MERRASLETFLPRSKKVSDSLLDLQKLLSTKYRNPILKVQKEEFDEKYGPDTCNSPSFARNRIPDLFCRA
jgi:hypothetical protein